MLAPRSVKEKAKRQSAGEVDQDQATKVLWDDGIPWVGEYREKSQLMYTDSLKRGEKYVTQKPGEGGDKKGW